MLTLVCVVLLLLLLLLLANLHVSFLPDFRISDLHHNS